LLRRSIGAGDNRPGRGRLNVAQLRSDRVKKTVTRADDISAAISVSVDLVFLVADRLYFFASDISALTVKAQVIDHGAEGAHRPRGRPRRQ
jgi:hypothetical protein